MRPTLVAEAIAKAVQVQQPLFVWGPPGAGKSNVTAQVTHALNMKLVDLRLTLLDSIDLRGFPHMRDGRMQFAVPIFLPTDPDSKGVLFLDEMNAAPPAVQAAGYQLILDRKIGEYTLPNGWAMIAAGNRETDQGITYTMPAPLANRFTHIDYEVNFDDWRVWALKKGIKTEVINFISFRPDLLMDFDPDKRAFPTPRSWEFVSRIIDGTQSIEVERALIAGSIGDGAASELAAFLKIYRNLPNPDGILLNPKSGAVPKDLATLYALCGALANRASETNFERLIQYCDRLPPEFATLCVRDSVNRHPPLADTKVFSDWAINNASVLV